MSKGVNSSAPTTGEIIAGVYNATPPTLVDGQAAALQVDINGQLKTAGGGGGGGNVNITGINGSAPALANPLPVELSDGTNPVGTAGNPLSVNVITGGGSNASVGTTGVLAPTSATEIGVIDGTGKLQGASASNPVRVDPTGTTTQPVSGTVTANAGTNLNTSALALDATLTNASQKTKIVDTGGVNVASVSAAGAVKVDGSAVTQPISGTIATNADTTIGGTVAPSKEFLVAGKTNDGTPQYQPIPEGAGGRSVIVEGIAGGTVVPISGTVTANQGTNNATPWNQNLSQVGGSAVSLGAKVSASSVPVVLASDQANIPSVVSAANSSTAALGSNAVFTGTSESVLGFEQITVIAFANQASAAAGLSVQQSQDGTNWDTTHTITVAASTNTPITVPVLSQFFRVVYTNGASAQATFRLQTIKQVFNNGVVRGAVASGSTAPNSFPVVIGGNDSGSGNIIRNVEIASGGSRPALLVSACGQTFTDNSTGIKASADSGGGNGVQAVAICVSTGAAAQSMLRTPAVFKTASIAATSTTTASNPVWTPAAGKKFRLMKFQITAQGLAATASAAVTVTLVDSATTITIGTYDIDIPAVAGVITGVSQISGGLIDLGNGFLSAAANNILNFGISAAGAGTLGTYRINVCGTEE